MQIRRVETLDKVDKSATSSGPDILRCLKLNFQLIAWVFALSLMILGYWERELTWERFIVTLVLERNYSHIWAIRLRLSCPTRGGQISNLGVQAKQTIFPDFHSQIAWWTSRFSTLLNVKTLLSTDFLKRKRARHV